MDQVRILYLSDYGGLMGGAAVSLVSLAKRLDREHYEVHAVLGSGGEFADAVRELGADVTIAELLPIVRSWCPFINVRNAMRLIRGCRAVMCVCREKKIDIIHANDNTVIFYAVISAMMTGCRCVWHVRSGVSRLRWLGGFLTKRCDAIIFCSESNAEPFKRFFPKHTQKMFIAYEGVDVAELAERSRGPSIRQELGIGADMPLVGLVGRVAWIKGQDEFLKAALIVSKLHPKARFAIVGEPVAGSIEALEADREFGNSLMPLCEKLGIADRVYFTSYRRDIPAVMKDLTVLAVPSRREGLGLVALEAMAIGVPVVATNVGGLPEVIQNGVNGLLVPPNAAGALGLAIARLLDDKPLARRLADEARRTVEQRFSADVHAKTVSDVYRLLSGRTEKELVS